MKNSKFTYQKSGVNIKIADKFVNFISKKANKKKKFLKIQKYWWIWINFRYS